MLAPGRGRPGVPVPRGAVMRAGLLIGAAPGVALLLLMATGALAAGPGLGALAVTGLAALGLGRLWIGNLARLSDGLRRAAEGDGGFDRPSFAPLLPAVAEVADGVARLARRLAEQAEEVGQLQRADQAIVEALPDPLLVLAPDRRPLRANAAARALFGPVAGVGGDIAALLRHPVLAGAVDRALAAGAPQAVDVTLPVPVTRELAARVVPMDPPLADGGRVVVLLADRTRERAVERMRADFVANASHELRTPLASLIGFIETLRGPAADDPAAQQRFLGIMAEQSERMRRLIDDLLGLSRIELTEHQPPTGRAVPAEIVAAEAAALGPLAQARRATIRLELDAAAVAAPADAEQLAQVARNLVENAIRYGEEGGAVTVRVARAGPGQDRRLPARPGVLIAVQDEGPGIPREHIPRLTERFYRVDRGRSRTAGGTGLGLAIVKHIVNRHRGVLLIDSTEGEGSLFRVWLPAAEEPAGNRAPQGEPPGAAGTAPPGQTSRAAGPAPQAKDPPAADAVPRG